MTHSDIVSRVDIVAVIGSCFPLTPFGDGKFRALCPFHTEQIPSFVVDRLLRTYQCDGCRAHGDVVEFLVAWEHIEQREAIRRLTVWLNT